MLNGKLKIRLAGPCFRPTIGPMSEQKVRHDGVVLKYGNVKKRKTGLVTNVNVSATVDKKLGNVR